MLSNQFSKSFPAYGSANPQISAISRPADNGGNAAAADKDGIPRKSLPECENAAAPSSYMKKRSSAPPGTYEYTVKEGENLRGLAAQFDTTPSVLKKLNRLTMDFLYPGQVLWIPNADYAALNTKPAKSAAAKSAADSATLHTGGDGKQNTGVTQVAQKQEKILPGYILRTETSCHSIEDELELPPRPLTSDEAAYLDQECFERFIKIESFYITEHDGPVEGVLLITPNAVMFDPNVSAPIVISKGAEEFGMIACMDTIMSAAIYHDIGAMECLNKRKSDPTVEKPPVYHSKSPEAGLSPVTTPSADSPTADSATDTNCEKSAPQPLQSSASLSNSSFILNPASLLESSPHDGTPADSSLLLPLDSNTSPSNTQTSELDQSDASGPLTFNLNDVDESKHIVHQHSESTVSSASVDKTSAYDNEPLTLSDNHFETATSTASDHSSSRMHDAAPSSQSEDTTLSVHQSDGGEGCDQSDSAVMSGEHSVVDEQSSCEFLFVDRDLSCSKTVGNSSFYVSIERPTTHSSQTRKAQHQKKKRHKKGDDRFVAPLVQLHGAVTLDDRPKLFEPLNDLVPEGSVTGKANSYTKESCLFLCLRVGQSISKGTVSSSSPETYHRKIRPEYWFSVPRDKVDKLYAFFIHWTSEVYDNEDASTVEKGFIAITENHFSKDVPSSPKPSPGSKVIRHKMGRQVSLDWEIVSLEEVRRRRTLEDIERYMPLPELLDESRIFTETHIRKLARCLPARVEGYPWAMAFCSEQHGFSLSQLYRNLQDVDSPVLLVIHTTENHVFGALSSCAFRTSESFYGTGESFLFTFVNDFKTYPWSGSNSFFNKGDQTSLSIGCGEGSYGLWIDGDIYIGRTQNCQTYANDPLTGGPEDFHIKQLEVWCFHDEC